MNITLINIMYDRVIVLVMY